MYRPIIQVMLFLAIMLSSASAWAGASGACQPRSCCVGTCPCAHSAKLPAQSLPVSDSREQWQVQPLSWSDASDLLVQLVPLRSNLRIALAICQKHAAPQPLHLRVCVFLI